MDTEERDRICRMLESVEKEEERNAILRQEQDRVRKVLFQGDIDDEHEILNGDDSEGDEDHVEVSDHNTDSEESADECSEASSPSNNSPFYIARDGNTRWNIHKGTTVGRGRIRRRNIVSHLPGPRGEAKNVLSAIESWTLFFPHETLDTIVTYTNIWIRKYGSNFERERDALPTSRAELKAVIGLLYLGGVLKSSHTNLEDLYSKDGTGVDLFPMTMNIKRLRFLLRAIRFDDIETRNERIQVDKLSPIRELFEGFVERCKTAYSVSEYVTIDEMLEMFRGRCSFRQYIANKPSKYGIKIFSLADARTYYTLNMEVYVGTNPDGPFRLNNSGQSVVERLVQPISGSGRNVTTDNWYTSIPLAQSLLTNHKLTLVGTLRKNKREVPPLFVETKGKPVRSSIFGYQEDALLLSYVPKKNKVVLLLSTMHDDDGIDKSSGEAEKPDMLTFYNLTKGGVDVVDELKALYSVSRKSNRWPLTLFYTMLNIAGINSYVILKSRTEIKSRRSFLKALAIELCREYMEFRVGVRSVRCGVKRKLTEYLGIKREKSATENCNNSEGRCAYCDRKKNRKTKTTCKECSKFICREHTTFMCVGCVNGNGDDNEESDE